MALFSAQKWQMQNKRKRHVLPESASVCADITHYKCNACKSEESIASFCILYHSRFDHVKQGGPWRSIACVYRGIVEALLRLSNNRHDSHTLPLYCYKCMTCLHQTVPPNPILPSTLIKKSGFETCTQA